MDRRRFLTVSAAGVLGTVAAAALPAAPALAAPATTATAATAAIIGVRAQHGLEVLIDIAGNKYHERVDGIAIGLWTDSAMSVYRGPAVARPSHKGVSYTAGNQFAIVPNAQNFRFNVGEYGNGHSFTNLERVLDSAYDTTDQHFNYMNWLHGCWAEGHVVHAVGHHEEHEDTVLVNGLRRPNPAPKFHERGPRGIKWYRSDDLGLHWHQQRDVGSARMIVVPQPWHIERQNFAYGWAAPTNIVKEGGYYYFSAISLRKVKGKIGISLFRMSDLDDVNSMQFYNANKQWESRNPDPDAYQGNLSLQQPYIFFQGRANTARASSAIRYHGPTKQWLMFGVAAGDLVYSRSATLADPQFEASGHDLIKIHPAAPDTGQDYTALPYINVFDPHYDVTDQNMMTIGNDPMLVVARKDRGAYRCQRLQIDVLQPGGA